ncbi:MAG: adenylosuccinate lyase, partial [Chloroflexi bacterium]|nr:adenylosuccinate lyase [Chloroflexota bacterium]
EQSLVAWQALQNGQPNPLGDLLAHDERITRYVDAAAIPEMLDASEHIGDAPERARLLAAEIRRTVTAQ